MARPGAGLVVLLATLLLWPCSPQPQLHLRTGSLKLSREPLHRRIARAALDDSGSSGQAPAPRVSPWWGPLASQELYIIAPASRGSDHQEAGPCVLEHAAMHGEPAEQRASAGDGQQALDESSSGWTGSGSSQLEREVVSILDAHSGTVVSFLPPSSWLVLAPSEAAEEIHLLHGVCMAPLPQEHKLAPEWQHVTEELQQQQQQQQQQQAAHRSPPGSVTEQVLSVAEVLGGLDSPAARGQGTKPGKGSTSDAPLLNPRVGSAEGMDEDAGDGGAWASKTARLVVGDGSAWRRNIPSLTQPDSAAPEVNGSRAGVRRVGGAEGQGVARKRGGVFGTSGPDDDGVSAAAAARDGDRVGTGEEDEQGVLVEVHFPLLTSADLRRLHLRPPSSAWTRSPCAGVVPEQAGGVQERARSMVRRCWPDVHEEGTYAPVAAALHDWPAALQQASIQWQQQQQQEGQQGQEAQQGQQGQQGASGVGTDPTNQGRRPGCGVSLQHEHGVLLVHSRCPLRELVWLLPWLAAQPSVQWLSPSAHVRLHNLEASSVVQASVALSTSAISFPPSSRTPAPSTPLQRPLWAAGLDGTGEVIGCGDTGVDVYACYFYDDAVPFTISLDAQDTPVFSSTRHRKLRLYMGLQDLVDANGHGSHTAGTLVGSPFGTDAIQFPDSATGIAPGAKLAFIDLARDGSNQVITGGDLSTYFPHAYRVGARVHSDSWGSSLSAYELLSRSVDVFTWEQQDFVSVFAIGNFGASSTSTTTATTPAIAKNTIAVGATLSSHDVTSSDGLEAPVWRVQLQVMAGQRQLLNRTFRALQASFGPDVLPTIGASPLPLVAASPSDACTGLANAPAAAGAILLVVRGNCLFTDKVMNAQAAGAAAVVVTDTQSGGYFTMALTQGSGPQSGFRIPMVGVPISTGRWLWLAVQAGQSATLSFSPYPANNQPVDDVASYSSFGPTLDGRIKPDIVAPGHTISCGTSGRLSGRNNGCIRTEASGTSMAAPIVAAAAAIVRQYFTQGFYPTFTRTPAHAYTNVSGMLVKAVLLGGAAPMAGNVLLPALIPGGRGQRIPLEEPPSYRQGFGRLDLGASLPLPSSPLGWNMQVVDRATLANGESHQYCVYATGGPLRVTLVWYDPPADLNAATVLVNNLDLEVRSAGMSGLLLQGNGHADAVNTAETVSLDFMPPGTVAISVVAKSVFMKYSPQPYALVVLGRFTGVLLSAANPGTASSASARPGGSDASSACAAALALISDASSTPPISTSQRATFTFTSSLPGRAAFECQLSNAMGETSGDQFAGPLHAWRACTSPAVYSALPDGTYSFQVRPVGQELSDMRRFTVDTQAPATTLSSTLPPAIDGTSPTAQEAVTFTFSASDLTDVTFKCDLRLTAVAGAQAPPHFRASLPALSIGSSNVPCTSPITLEGLYSGDWEFMVRGMDAGGNTDAGRTARWAGSYQAGVLYTRTAAAPPTLTSNASLAFALYTFLGSGPGAAPVLQDSSQTTFRYALTLQPDEGSGLGAEAPAWNQSTGPRLLATAPRDGLYRFSAGVAPSGGSGTAPEEALATALVRVDTVPPVLQLVSGPSPVQPSPVVTVQYQTVPQNDAVAYLCRWLFSALAPPNVNTVDMGDSAFKPCSGTGIATRASASAPDGYGLFQVKARDAAGNLSPPLSVAFRTDTQPPSIQITTPRATSAARVSLAYSVAQAGPRGAGIANVTCLMSTVWVSGNSALNASAPGGAAPPPAVSAASGGAPPSSNTSLANNAGLAGGQPLDTNMVPCPGSPLAFVLREGLYRLSVTARTVAGLSTEQDVAVVVDATPPVTRVTTRPPGGGAFPSRVALEFIAMDLPNRTNAGINTSLCWLTCHSCTDGLRGQLPDGNPIPASTWVPCVSPFTYRGLRSAVYSFKVLASDNAGNMGTEASNLTFTVDDTLPIDEGTSWGSGSGNSAETNMLVVGIVVGIAALLMVAIAIGVVFLRRRVRRRALTEGGSPYALPVTASSQPGPQPATVSATMLGEWERERRRVAIQLSIEEEQMRKALQESLKDLEERRVQAALKASLANPTRR